MTSKRKILLTGLAALALSGCGSLGNGCNDISRNMVRSDYHLTLYNCEGNPILDKDIKNTYIRVDENGSGLRYVENGKLVLINGTYVLTQK